MSLHLWSSLSLAVENGWGGPDSSDKRDWFAGVIVDLFPAYTDAAPPTTTTTNSAATTDPTVPELIEDVETVLLQVMVDEFDVAIEDDSAYDLARQLVNVYTQCAQGEFAEANTLAERFRTKKAGAAGAGFKKVEDQDQDTDWESDEDGDEGDSDDEMDEAPALVQTAPAREKVEPQVDEDGFTTVVSKKRR
ncbi:hypothetical protein TD95_004385 [Thielaviopsis punctulata]|uniref:Pre-rRNA-processing protein TSR2 n=1 Tax=Thielaviopsis punctulata TaxID=72032 RepID=A0A0F4ZJJ3_9PEZI|nr:hypothetical protein TD95_004385 [Thielaviopsis punctulata]